jgi:hypothetical protein
MKRWCLALAMTLFRSNRSIGVAFWQQKPYHARKSVVRNRSRLDMRATVSKNGTLRNGSILAMAARLARFPSQFDAASLK